jgi:hypothetical protein
MPYQKNLMTAKKSIYLIPFLLLFVNCKSRRVYEKIEFENNYTFNSQIQDKLAKDTVNWKYQISAGEYAIKGDYRNALEQWDIAFPGKSKTVSQKQIDSVNAKYTIVPATDYIIERAKKNQVVIINEAHNNSFHRLFTKGLLEKLYENGYKNLGLEALTNGADKDSLLNQRGYPIQESGYYTKDPQFGNLIRTALKIGYTVFPYEQTSDVNGKEREIEQAQNIKKILDKNPNEKFIIHCGFDHVLEGNHRNWGKAMAGRLHEFTGINPLTINQTKYSERSKSELNDPLLQALDLKESSILLQNSNKPLDYERRESFADIAVLHPTTKYVNNRPNWLFESPKKDIPIKLNNLDISFPVMVLAYINGEEVDRAVPTDIIEIQNKGDIGYLALEKGGYNIIINNELAESLKFEMQVK